MPMHSSKKASPTSLLFNAVVAEQARVIVSSFLGTRKNSLVYSRVCQALFFAAIAARLSSLLSRTCNETDLTLTHSGEADILLGRE